MSAIEFGKIPVFPVILNGDGTEKQTGPNSYQHSGLSARELYAAMALQGILANRVYDPPRRNKLKEMAEDAVAAADALLCVLHDTE